MKRALRTQVTYEHSETNAPQFTVAPGELFEAETELCSGTWLTGLDSVWSRDRLSPSNPTVVVAVEGARPGDSVRLRIHRIVPDTIGYTGFDNGHELAKRIIDRDWGNNIRIVRIKDDLVRFSSGIELPIRPMIGTLGTAPRGAPQSNSRGHRQGGNMDAQEICAGAIVTLPVEVPGALLHIGDVHAIQGDGEINGSGGIECRSLVTLSAELVPRPARNGCVRVENDSELCAIACEGDMENCCVLATRELLFWICDGYGMDEKDAYLLLGQVMSMRVTQLVNPTHTIIASIRKSYLS